MSKQQIPAPKMTPPTVMPTAPAVALVPAPAPPPTTTRGIELIDPDIELLTQHIFVRKGDHTNTNRLNPKRAVIVEGAIVIDELNLILPLAGSLIRIKRS